MKKLFPIIALLALILPVIPQEADAQYISVTGQVEVADTTTGIKGAHPGHGGYTLDFSLADSLDLAFLFEGEFHGTVTMAPKSSLLPDEAKRDTIRLIATDTHRVLQDSIITMEYWQIRALMGALRAYPEWELFVRPMPGCSAAALKREFEILAKLEGRYN